MKYLTLFLMCVLLNPVYGGKKSLEVPQTPDRLAPVSASSTPQTRSQVLEKRKRNLFSEVSGTRLPASSQIGSPLPSMLSSTTAHTSVRPSAVRPSTIVTFYPDDVNEADIFGPEPTNEFVQTEPPHCRQEDFYAAAKKARRGAK